jgi:hypothetical protein
MFNAHRILKQNLYLFLDIQTHSQRRNLIECDTFYALLMDAGRMEQLTFTNFVNQITFGVILSECFKNLAKNVDLKLEIQSQKRDRSSTNKSTEFSHKQLNRKS